MKKTSIKKKSALFVSLLVGLFFVPGLFSEATVSADCGYSWVEVPIFSPSPPSPTCELSASDTSIAVGESTVLSWTTDMTSFYEKKWVFIEPDICDVSESGSFTVSPTETTTYALNVVGSHTGKNVPGHLRSDICEVTITVEPPVCEAPEAEISYTGDNYIGGYSSWEWSWENKEDHYAEYRKFGCDDGTGFDWTPWTPAEGLDAGETGDWYVDGSHAGCTYEIKYTVENSCDSDYDIASVTFESPEEPEHPLCDYFEITPSSRIGSGNVTFEWGTTNADRVYITNGVGDVSDDGSMEVWVSESGTYELIVTNSEGTDRCEDTVTVTPREPKHPVCDSFTITPESREGAGLVTFSWETTNATDVSIDNGVGSVPVDGTKDVYVSENETYTLTASNVHGEDMCSDTVGIETPKPQDISITAHKIVCDDEADLPNWGTGGSDITAQTASQWVNAYAGCKFESDWKFQWGPQNAFDPGDTFIGEAGGGWNTFGPTDSNGKATVIIDSAELRSNNSFWVREALKEGYVPFTYSSNGDTNVDDYSAEMYCHTDVKNYDNFDRIDNLQEGGEYYCVAWNVLKDPVEPGTPDIEIIKRDAIDKDDIQVVLEGGVAQFEIVVTNIGHVDLKDVEVTDPITNSCAKSIGNLAVGESDTYTCMAQNVLTSFTNTAFVDGKSVEDDTPVDDNDPSEVVVEGQPGSPNIDIIKRDAVDKDDTQTVQKGGTAQFEIVVTNTGTVDLKDIEVTDPITNSCAKSIGNLAVGESDTYTCAATDVQNSFTNTAFVDGKSVEDDTPVDDNDPSEVVVEEEPEDMICDYFRTDAGGSVNRNEKFNLEWETTNATDVSINQGVGNVSVDGTKEWSVTSDTTFILTYSADGYEPKTCETRVDVRSGGSSSKPRCDLEISDTKVDKGDYVTLSWDNTRTNDILLEDDHGKTYIDTKRNDDDDDEYDEDEDSIRVRVTKDTEFTLFAIKGSRDDECSVDVEINDGEVAGISYTGSRYIDLGKTPYTGFDTSDMLAAVFFAAIAVWGGVIAYAVNMRRRQKVGGVETGGSNYYTK